MYLSRQLRARVASFVWPAESKTSIPSLVGDLLNAMLRRVNPIALSSSEVISYLTFLHEIGQQGQCAGILNRLVEEKALTPSHITARLVPLIGDLTAFLSQKSINQSSQPYASFFKAATFAWCRKVLGAKPPDVSTQVANVVRSLNGCCQSCKPVATFLQSSNKRDLRLDRVGAPLAKHMDTKMRSCCSPNFATWTIIMSNPRGFQVCYLAPIFEQI